MSKIKYKRIHKGNMGIRVTYWGFLPDEQLNGKLVFVSPVSFAMGFDNVTDLQFTGLYDKNGKEIYEGSGGVHNEFGAYYIKYGMYREPTNGGIHHGYYVKFIDRKRNRMFRKDLGYWARIRTLDFSKNIYENPELLEEK